jgi:hypothetical protein
MLTGCGGSQPPIGAPLAMPQSRAVATHVDRSGSWMSPGANSGDLLYVSDAGSKVVNVYSYPRGTKVGQLTGFESPQGLCVDRAGDVFVTNSVASGSSNILEFAHGGKTPIRTLSNPGMAPSGCAVNLTTGDLAVTNYCPLYQGGCGSGNGDLIIYRKGSEPPKRHSRFSVRDFSFCGYDSAGNLYADGYDRRASFTLVELPKGAKNLVRIRIHFSSSNGILYPGAVQWDGKLLAIGEQQVEFFNASVYRVDPASGNIVAILPLHGSFDVPQFFIDGKVLIAPDSRAGKSGLVLFYNYPSGSKIRKTIGGLSMPFGAVVSPGTRR